MISDSDYALSVLDNALHCIKKALNILDSIANLDKIKSKDRGSSLEIEIDLHKEKAVLYVVLMHDLVILSGIMTPAWRNKGVWQYELEELQQIMLSLGGLFSPNTNSWIVGQDTLENCICRLIGLEERLKNSIKEAVRAKEMRSRELDDQNAEIRRIIRRM